LGLSHRITEILSTETSLPAVGQGAIGIECRRDDIWLNECLKVLHHEETALCVMAERAFNKRLNGGCQVPIAGYAELSGDRLRLRGLVGTPDGRTLVQGEIEGPQDDPQALGSALAEDLLARGADRVLDALYT